MENSIRGDHQQENDSVQQKSKKKQKNKRELSRTDTNGDATINGISENVKVKLHINTSNTDTKSTSNQRQHKKEMELWNDDHDHHPDDGEACAKLNGTFVMQCTDDEVPKHHNTNHNGLHPHEHTSDHVAELNLHVDGIALNGNVSIINSNESRSKSNKSKNKLEQREQQQQQQFFTAGDGANGSTMHIAYKHDEQSSSRTSGNKDSTIDLRISSTSTTTVPTTTIPCTIIDDDDGDVASSHPVSSSSFTPANNYYNNNNNNNANDNTTSTATEETVTTPIPTSTSTIDVAGGGSTFDEDIACIATTSAASKNNNDNDNDTSSALSPELDLSNVYIEYKEYESELQMHDIMRLIQAELSEPYSIYTYRYFIYNWPKLCFLAAHGNEYVGAIVCKLDMHMSVRRGYIAMLAVRKEYRKLRIGTTLVQKAIEAMLLDNADEVVLETEMCNLPALRLYENLGFVRDKRLFRYYLNGVDALRLKLWFR